MYSYVYVCICAVWIYMSHKGVFRTIKSLIHALGASSSITEPTINSSLWTFIEQVNIKESIYIRMNNPILNRNVGKYNLHHVWDTVLFSTLELRINGHAHRTPISGHAQTLPPSRHVHRTVEHLGHAQRTPPSEHAIEHHRIHTRHWNSPFSSDQMKSSMISVKACLKNQLKFLENGFLYNRMYFLEDTSFFQSYWSGFIWCMGKCFSYQDTWVWWCLKKKFSS